MSKKLSIILFYFVTLNCPALYAQLCQGSLGDPIVNITFGTGPAQGNPLSAATTSYQFYGADCPTDGFYTVRNTSSGCFGNTWHTLNQDHTGNGGGYFMLVNASFQPSAFYIDTVRGLCGNTTYEFASWICNMVSVFSCGGNTIQPDITFTIESTSGAVLHSYNSGSIPANAGAIWKQYGFFFTTPPAGQDIVLRMVNNAPGGCGNDLALDDITFRPCGPQITGAINGVPSAPVTFCQGIPGNYTLSATASGGFTIPSYQWQYRNASGIWTDIPGEINNSMAVNFPVTASAGSYQYRLAVAETGNINTLQCRVYSQPFIFNINAKPVTTANNSGPVCIGSEVTLTATGGGNYSWRGPNGFVGNVSTVNVITQSDTRYYVTVTSAEGCISVDSTLVLVNQVPVAMIAKDSIAICNGDTTRLSGSGGNVYLWNPASSLSGYDISDPLAFPDTFTRYQLIITNEFNCSDTAYTIVNVLEKPKANAGPDKSILQGQSVILQGSFTGEGNINWSPAAFLNDPFILQPVAELSQDISYILNISSLAGCGVSSDTMNIKVYDDIFIPNAFTPNGDGLNDTWNIPALDAYTDYSVTVFSRWGEKLFQMRNIRRSWDGFFKGKPLPMGAYFYIIQTPFQQFKGSIMLIR